MVGIFPSCLAAGTGGDKCINLTDFSGREFSDTLVHPQGKKKKRYSHSSVAHPVNGNVSWVSLHFLLKMLRALFCDIVASLLPVNPRTIAKCFQK